MSDNKKSRRGFGKGYYIALILCAAAIGITGYLYDRNSNRSQETLETEDSAQVMDSTGGADVEAIATTQPRQDAARSTPEKSGDTATALKTTWPVTGTAVAEYAMETLSYNATTRDWRVHDGLDIAADAGSEVVAAADGQVYTIYQDDALGTTVVIRHVGGYTTRYASMDEELAVSVGDSVTAGQVIGTVGDTALVETGLGTHVHFSVSCQDVPMDPLEFLEMN